MMESFIVPIRLLTSVVSGLLVIASPQLSATPCGDTNEDNVTNILDVVSLVHHILGHQPLTSATALTAADRNCDDQINVSDIVILVNDILGESLRTVFALIFVRVSSAKNHPLTNAKTLTHFSPTQILGLVTMENVTTRLKMKTVFLAVKVGHACPTLVPLFLASRHRRPFAKTRTHSQHIKTPVNATGVSAPILLRARYVPLAVRLELVRPTLVPMWSVTDHHRPAASRRN